MGIRRIAASSVEAATITIPSGYKAGDLLIIYAFRGGSTTNPTIPAGWTTITNTTDGTGCSVSMGYKVATSAAETSGTWTNASQLVCNVYGGQLSSGTPVGAIAANAGTTNSAFNYAARTLAAGAGSSWFAAFASHKQINTTLETPPAGMALATTLVGTYESAAFDTNAAAPTDWPSTNVSIGGTNDSWQTVVLEVKAATNPIAYGRLRPHAFSPGLAR